MEQQKEKYKYDKSLKEIGKKLYMWKLAVNRKGEDIVDAVSKILSV
ncbi:hypothetical protein P8V03_07220 [Clostridium sp. A1-XYC3]|uniref:Uncharacterized protein n=1 Tax=Clostridium tanneri TaxID=3037988 RepID=A0ABU4JS06_9CLOT|nr:hypothetical protein [Clostridium sp. A1-XYC3]MDW8800942.1 hypothetical protein [Clostridium sp. A1-XYC3]